MGLEKLTGKVNQRIFKTNFKLLVNSKNNLQTYVTVVPYYITYVCFLEFYSLKVTSTYPTF